MSTLPLSTKVNTNRMTSTLYSLQPKPNHHFCKYCGKNYVRKTAMEKHQFICELTEHSRHAKNMGEYLSHLARDINDADMERPPVSNEKIYSILLELGNRFQKLERKVDALSQWARKTKKQAQLGGEEWLRIHVYSPLKWDKLGELICVENSDMEYAFHHSFVETLQRILERTLYLAWNTYCQRTCPYDDSYYAQFLNQGVPEKIPAWPMVCLPSKTHAFYIYDKDQWTLLAREDFNKFLNKLHAKIFKKFVEWKKTHCDKIHTDEAFALMCDKTTMKLVQVEFNDDGIFHKIRSNMYSHMKRLLPVPMDDEKEFIEEDNVVEETE